MKFRYTICFVCLLLPVVVFAQYDNLLHKPYSKKVAALNLLYQQLINLNDSVKVARKVANIKAIAKKTHDKELEVEMELFKAYYNVFFKQGNAHNNIARLNTVIALADKAKIKHIKIRAMRMLATYYWNDLGNYELAFELYLKQDRELSLVKAKDYPDMAKDLLQIAHAYYFFHDYTIAQKYLKKIIALPETEFNTRFINSAKNTMGLCYQQQKKLELADYYFEEVLKTPFPQSKKDWERIVKGNIGTNYYLRKAYDKAIPLLVNDYIGAQADHDFGPAAGALISLADIFLEKHQMKTSWEYIELAQKNIQKSNQIDRKRFLYPIISKWYSINGKSTVAKQYVDSAVTAINEYYEKFSAVKVLRAQQKINKQEEKLQLAEFTLIAQQKNNERNMLIIVVVALCLTIILGYYIQRKKQIARDLKLQMATQELEIATLNLNRFTQSIAEKNNLIEVLQSHRSEEEHIALINRLQQSTILTDEDWKQFQLLFDKAYPGFIHRLKQTYPDLSIGDIRYFVLSKLNLSYKEMAGIIGVSPNTVQVMRHRIRKKLHFVDNDKMEEIINGL